MKFANAIRNLALVAASALFAIALAEALASFLLHSGAAYSLLPEGLVPRFRTIYNVSIRSVVQFEPECARFDPEVFYTLRPGACRFRNPEFDTTLRVNSQGFRDSEEAWNSPEIIVLGDSVAMGWGVDGAETFARRLGERTGLKVLNTGISSYGTVREKIVMSRVPLDRLKYLVIQYNPNDQEENQLFYLRDNAHRSQGEDQFDEVSRRFRENRKYFPGRSLSILGAPLVQKVFGRNARNEPFFTSWTEADRRARERKPALSEAELFVNALANAGAPLPVSLRKIVVFSVDAGNADDQKMIGQLRVMKAEHRLDHLPGEIVVLDASRFVARELFFVLDDHPRPAGHAAIADALAPHFR